MAVLRRGIILCCSLIIFLHESFGGLIHTEKDTENMINEFKDWTFLINSRDKPEKDTSSVDENDNRVTTTAYTDAISFETTPSTVIISEYIKPSAVTKKPIYSTAAAVNKKESILLSASLAESFSDILLKKELGISNPPIVLPASETVQLTSSTMPELWNEGKTSSRTYHSKQPVLMTSSAMPEPRNKEMTSLNISHSITSEQITNSKPTVVIAASETVELMSSKTPELLNEDITSTRIYQSKHQVPVPRNKEMTSLTVSKSSTSKIRSSAVEEARLVETTLSNIEPSAPKESTSLVNIYGLMTSLTQQELADTGTTWHATALIEQTLQSTISATTTSVSCVCVNSVCLSRSIVEATEKRIVDSLKISTSSLSSTRRKCTSAGDTRRSSTSMGYVAVVVIVVPMTLVLIGDIPKIIHHIKYGK